MNEYLFPAIGAVLFGAFGLYFVLRTRYYNRLFSPESFREFHERLSKALQVAQSRRDQCAVADADTAFVTGAGLQVVVSASREENVPLSVHISLSQQGVTTHAACSRFAFFVIMMLQGQKSKLTPFFTDSGVHHMVIRFQTETLNIVDFDTSYSRYVSDYQPVPFVRNPA